MLAEKLKIMAWEVKNNGLGKNAGCRKTDKFIIFCDNDEHIKIDFFPAFVLLE